MDLALGEQSLRRSPKIPTEKPSPMTKPNLNAIDLKLDVIAFK
jgi:hypothetical protein